MVAAKVRRASQTLSWPPAQLSGVLGLPQDGGWAVEPEQTCTVGWGPHSLKGDPSRRSAQLRFPWILLGKSQTSGEGPAAALSLGLGTGYAFSCIPPNPQNPCYSLSSSAFSSLFGVMTERFPSLKNQEAFCRGRKPRWWWVG